MEKRFARNSWWFILICLTLSVIAARLSAFSLRFDFDIPSNQQAHLALALALDLPLKLAIFYWARLHRGWSSQIGIPDLKRIVLAVTAAAAVVSAILFWADSRFPRSIYMLDLLLMIVFISGIRVGVRMFLDARKHRTNVAVRHNVLIYGAGRAAASLMREVGPNPHLGMRIVGLVDDDPLKQKETVLGCPVLGFGNELLQVVNRLRKRNIRVEQVLIAIPSASGKQMRQAIANCRNAGLVCKTLPGISDLLANKGLSAQIRDIALEDLLGRDPVELDEAQIRKMIQGTRVLVTGAAGSIGSELCRQVASYLPHQMVLLDQAESGLFTIEMELRKEFPALDMRVEIADIRNFQRVENIVRAYAIESVFHAAAYKHVPMMEAHCVEAVVNNVLGTWNLATVAAENDVKSFVMISSDKAVNPTNVMGATKRAAELVVSSFAGESRTKFVSVRFGNVLGSNGSVVPIFKSQISSGGPVTVTHPEVRRYFMTVREAVQLVLQASTMGNGNEVFVLDMGEPVRIVDLARNLIRLAGLVPDKDVRIEYCGLRPGEKLYEELITEGENIAPTYHKKIKIFKSEPIRRNLMEVWLDELRTLVADSDNAAVVAHLAKLIPEYAMSSAWTDVLRARANRIVVGSAGARKAFRTAV